MDIKKLEAALFQDEDISKAEIKRPDVKFQRLIAWILSILGFKTIELGDTKYKVVRRRNGVDIGDVDILAQDIENKRTYAIACMLTPSANEKIDKLANIVERLRREGVKIEPLIFVNERASQAKSNNR